MSTLPSASPDSTRSGGRLQHILRYSRVVKELKAKIKTETRERIEDKLKRWQQLSTPELSEDVQAVRDWSPEWAETFQREAERLREGLGSGRVSQVEHFGSSAVPGLPSKGILDLVVAIDEQDLLGESARLEELGYHSYGVSPCDPEAHWFWNTEPTDHAFVAHLCTTGNPWIQTALDFRDYMRVHPDECVRYEQLKDSLKEERERSLLEYSAKKLLLFYEVSDKARAWRAAPPQNVTSG